jgi:SAM-dependent methyltransferase
MGILGKLHADADRHNKDRILDLCEPVPSGSFVDLGCGSGEFTLELARQVGVSDPAGVEFVGVLAAEARERGVRAVTHDLNLPLPFDDESFDVVHSNQVIEHLVKTDVFLKEIHRILKPSGYAIISTNNLASWHNIAMLALGLQPLPCHVSDEFAAGNPLDPYRDAEKLTGSSHLRVFAYRGLRDLLRLHGFDVDQLVTSGYYPFPPRVADRLCRIDRLHGAFLVARVRRAASTPRGAPSAAPTG